MQVVSDEERREVARLMRDRAPIDGEYRCSECGHLNKETYRPDKGWYKPRYCAHCGARVVDTNRKSEVEGSDSEGHYFSDDDLLFLAKQTYGAAMDIRKRLGVD